MPSAIRSAFLALAIVSQLTGLSGTASSGAASARATKTFRDLNRNGRLDPYEDRRLTPERRAVDLVRRMTLEEKAGAMMHGTLPGTGPGQIGVSSQGYDLNKVEELLARGINSFITRLALEPRELAAANNAVQTLAARTRLGIPVTISTDPRNHFQYVLGASSEAHGFSQWPDPLGFGALGDPALVRQFASIARREYRAVGIHMALSPQADLASEPRWPRATGTFGSTPARVAPLVTAYVEGFQGGPAGLQANGVLTVAKHWVGYGAQPEGYDGHNRYGRFATLDDRTFAQHLAAFDGALRARVAGVMPAYPILQGVNIAGGPIEPVAPGYNRVLLLGLLRGQKRFDGIILSDWGITRTCNAECAAPTKPHTAAEIATPWGVEDLSEDVRFVRGVEAGIDQFGGVDRPEAIVAAVRAGTLTQARIDASVRRVMAAKFRLGLFDNPLVDEPAAARIAGAPASQRLADAVQRRAQVLLKTSKHWFPLKRGTRVYVHGMSAAAVSAAGLVPVQRPDLAEVALFRLTTPSQLLHPNHFFGSRQHEGRLDFRDGDPDYEALKAASARVPVIASIYLDRPAILTNMIDRTAVLLGNFGASDAAVLDVVMGRARPEGRLPFELPSSMAAVEAQDPARPDDSRAPLFAAGFGLGAAGKRH